MSVETQESHPLIVIATEEGYLGANDPEWHWPAEGGVTVDTRDECLVQPLINDETVGATDLRMGLGRMLPGMYHIRHHHPYGSEYYYFTKGSCILHLDGKDIRATPGMAVYIPPNCVHALKNDTDEVAEFVVGCSKPQYHALGLVYDE